jgi:hypothetical protein
MVDFVSLAVALLAVAVSAFIYLETRQQRKLMEVMVESLAFLQKPSKPRRASKPRKPPASTPAPAPPATAQTVVLAPPSMAVHPRLDPKPLSAAEQARIALALRREERKRLELQLRQQREQWKRQKDVTKAIGWVLDRMGSDEDDEEDD